MSAAAFAASEGRPRRAARLWGAAEALLEAIEATAYTHRSDRSLHQGQVSAARARLDETSWVAAWSEGQVLGFNIAEANERSNTVTTVTMNGFDPAALQRYCKEKCGVVLGTGIGDLSGQAFRIAHMGHVNAPMVLGTLGVIEVGLNALNIPHGKGGTEAAIEYLGESVEA